MPNLRGLLFGLMDGHVTNFWLQALTTTLSCALLAWAAKTTLRKPGKELLLIAITASALASYHILIQDMTILLLPVVVMLDHYIGAEAGGNSRDRLKFRAAALAFTAPMLMSWAPRYFFLAAIPLLIFMFAISEPLRGHKAAA